MPEGDPDLTVLCVHGNPSWSYLWRKLLAALPTGTRGVAIDHLDMGFSERTGTVRRLGDRIDDLCELTESLGINGPVVTVAHDWGGPISLGWAQRHLPQLRGVVLTNTAVHQPEEAPAPAVIRAARSRGALHRATVDTTAFINGAFIMSHPRPPPEIRRGFLAPYETPERRHAIEMFVRDVPLEDGHPTGPVLDGVAGGLSLLANTPTLLLWGSRDLVFSDLYLHDLEARLPHAEVHRWAHAGHFVTEDADVAGAVVDWLTTLPGDDAAADRSSNTLDAPVSETEPLETTTLLRAVSDSARADTLAIKEMTGAGRSISFGALETRIERTAGGLRSIGVNPRDRVALMIPPGIDLAVAVYSCWRMGAVAVLVDGGLGPKQMGAALKAANPSYLIGIPKALAAKRTLRWPGQPISSVPLSTAQRRLLGAESDLESIASVGGSDVRLPGLDSDAAVVFTSGSTGPSKGVRYTHRQIGAQRDALMSLYDISADDRLVAAFAPFALYGPAMGITSVVPDMDVSAPGTLDAASLAAAADAIDATMVFASPAAIANLVRTEADIADERRAKLANIKTLLSAGAPVRASLLREARSIFPNAVAHTPYGMTEVLPVASISLPELDEVGPGDGVCVGFPVAGIEVMIRPIDAHGELVAEDTGTPGVLGEVIVSAPHARTGYDRLWHTTHLASQPSGWHATGDVGQLDDSGRLWIGGRLAHVIVTDHGVLAPVRIEKAIESIEGVAAAAAVGVGPVGTQQLVIVLERDEPARTSRLAPLALIDDIRAICEDVDVVAVLEVPKLPVDRRHNSKIDRTAIAAWAGNALRGGTLGTP